MLLNTKDKKLCSLLQLAPSSGSEGNGLDGQENHCEKPGPVKSVIAEVQAVYQLSAGMIDPSMIDSALINQTKHVNRVHANRRTNTSATPTALW